MRYALWIGVVLTAVGSPRETAVRVALAGGGDEYAQGRYA